MAWDVDFIDEDTLTAYRIRVKRLTVGDGVQVDTDQDAIANDREDLTGRALLNMRNYPLLQHATHQAECVTLDTLPSVTDADVLVLPDDLDWQPFELTETAFLGLSELLMWAWLGAIYQRNPHRSASYETLKKVLRRETPETASAPNTNGAALPASALETTSLSA